MGWDRERAKNNSHFSAMKLKRMYPQKQNECQQIKFQIAELLQQHKIENARIRAELLIQETRQAEILEIVEIFCEKVEARIDYMHQNKDIPPDMLDCISGIIYSASILGIEYQIELKKQLILKYGKDYGKKCELGDASVVNPAFKNKFLATIPTGEQISLNLLNIATEYKIDSYIHAYAAPVPPAPVMAPPPTSVPSFPIINEDPGPYSQNKIFSPFPGTNTQPLQSSTTPLYMISSNFSAPSSSSSNITSPTSSFTASGSDGEKNTGAPCFPPPFPTQSYTGDVKAQGGLPPPPF